jgi:hypothetical protein
MRTIKSEQKRTEQTATNTAFILMFPSLILAGMAALYAPIFGSLLAVALALYQFLMLKKFIEDYYRNRFYLFFY